MFITTLLVLTSLLPRIDGVADAVRSEADRTRATLTGMGMGTGMGVSGLPPAFVAEDRAVSNWRAQTGDNLLPVSRAFVARFAEPEPAFVARCVKLNNYWCIKSARWNGEIGADAEGHTAFATAADGADAAAGLLRRYYRVFGRRTALAIVRRWAPAECRLAGADAAAPGRGASGKLSTNLAPLGLGRTLRARYLARHGRGGVPRRAIAARGGPLRIQPWSPLARMGGNPRPKPVRVAAASDAAPAMKPSPVARTGLASPKEVLAKSATTKPTATSSGARLADRFVIESASLPAIAAGIPHLPPLDLIVPAPFCGDDEVRIRNYASRIAASVGLRIEDNLALFGPDGQALPNLGPVMLAMSGVELGTLRAGPALVEAAMARLAVTAVDATGTR